ncbi:MAG: hypothetical protein QXR89_07000 [Candidatus Bathyarchaeia archaeon]
MSDRAFLCQISEGDWEISRYIGVYGNREGSERKGEIQYFDAGSNTVQSIIEDLIGMRKGDVVFFHVLREKQESTIHGVYRVREEPFYNDQRIWKSENFVYPYRFCFEPHPEHSDLCKNDANITVSQFYAAVEAGIIRSILTLEREERGAAHAVKTITREDAQEIIKLLYREFSTQHTKQTIEFKPLKLSGFPLKNYIKRVGEIEFPVKAVVAYKLGRADPNFIQFIPACKNNEYDFLIQTFVGSTARKPVDLLCIGYQKSKKTITIIEAKKDKAEIKDLIQLLHYQEILRIRTTKSDNAHHIFSACLIAQKFATDLVDYCFLRNTIIPWEEVRLLKYTPTSNGTDADFELQTLSKPTYIAFKIYPKIATDISNVWSDPSNFYYTIMRVSKPKITVEISLQEKDVIILQKYFQHDSSKSPIGRVLIYKVHKKCTPKELTKFMEYLYKEVNNAEEKFMAVEPILIAQEYDAITASFIEKYNTYETQALRQPIIAFTTLDLHVSPDQLNTPF